MWCNEPYGTPVEGSNGTTMCECTEFYSGPRCEADLADVVGAGAWSVFLAMNVVLQALSVIIILNHLRRRFRGWNRLFCGDGRHPMHKSSWRRQRLGWERRERRRKCCCCGRGTERRTAKITPQRPFKVIPRGAFRPSVQEGPPTIEQFLAGSQISGFEYDCDNESSSHHRSEGRYKQAYRSTSFVRSTHERMKGSLAHNNNHHGSDHDEANPAKPEKSKHGDHQQNLIPAGAAADGRLQDVVTVEEGGSIHHDGERYHDGQSGQPEGHHDVGNSATPLNSAIGPGSQGSHPHGRVVPSPLNPTEAPHRASQNLSVGTVTEQKAVTSKYRGQFGPRRSSSFVPSRRVQLRQWKHTTIKDFASYLALLGCIFRMVWCIDPQSQWRILPEKVTQVFLLRLPQLFWMAAFTLMVIAWVSIVRSAKGKIVHRKIKRTGYIVVISYLILMIPATSLQTVGFAPGLLDQIVNGIVALYLVGMDVWGAVYALQIAGLTRALKRQLLAFQANEGVKTPSSHSNPNASEGNAATPPSPDPRLARGSEEASSVVSRASVVKLVPLVKLGLQGSEATELLRRAVVRVGVAVFVSALCGLALIVLVLLTILVPLTPNTTPAGYFAMMWGVHVGVEGMAALVLAYMSGHMNMHKQQQL